MNQIELIVGLPDWQWKDHSREEILVTGTELVGMSDFVWRIGHVAVVGFLYSNYLAAPWMWFVLAENVTIADLIDFRRLSTLIPKGTLTQVAVDFPVGAKFAKVYGFEDTGKELDYYGRAYKLWRKV